MTGKTTVNTDRGLEWAGLRTWDATVSRMITERSEFYITECNLDRVLGVVPRAMLGLWIPHRLQGERGISNTLLHLGFHERYTKSVRNLVKKHSETISAFFQIGQNCMKQA